MHRDPTQWLLKILISTVVVLTAYVSSARASMAWPLPTPLTPLGVASVLAMQNDAPRLGIEPQVSMAADGRVVVTWLLREPRGRSMDIREWRYRLLGSPNEAEFVDVDLGEDLVMVWTIEPPRDSTSGTRLHARLFRLSMFRDDFETGDLSAWSTSHPPHD